MCQLSRHLLQMHTMNYTSVYTGKGDLPENAEANGGGAPPAPSNPPLFRDA